MKNIKGGVLISYEVFKNTVASKKPLPPKLTNVKAYRGTRFAEMSNYPHEFPKEIGPWLVGGMNLSKFPKQLPMSMTGFNGSIYLKDYEFTIDFVEFVGGGLNLSGYKKAIEGKKLTKVGWLEGLSTFKYCIPPELEILGPCYINEEGIVDHFYKDDNKVLPMAFRRKRIPRQMLLAGYNCQIPRLNISAEIAINVAGYKQPFSKGLIETILEGNVLGIIGVEDYSFEVPNEVRKSVIKTTEFYEAFPYEQVVTTPIVASHLSHKQEELILASKPRRIIEVGESVDPNKIHRKPTKPISEEVKYVQIAKVPVTTPPKVIRKSNFEDFKARQLASNLITFNQPKSQADAPISTNSKMPKSEVDLSTFNTGKMPKIEVEPIPKLEVLGTFRSMYAPEIEPEPEPEVIASPTQEISSDENEGISVEVQSDESGKGSEEVLNSVVVVTPQNIELTFTIKISIPKAILN